MASYLYDSVQTTALRLVACFSYTPKHNGELSVSIGDEVLVREHQGYWVLAEHNNQLGYLPRGYLAKPDSLEAQPWYFPELTRSEAVELLLREFPGTYLVRPSSEEKNYALSIRTSIEENLVCHYQIHYDPSKGFYITPNLSDGSLRRLLSFYQSDEKNMLQLKQRLREACAKPLPRIYQLTPKNEEIDPNEIILKDTAGEGHFGEVRSGIYRHYKIAVKSLKRNDQNNSLWEKEIAPLQVLHHPNVVTCYGFCPTKKWIIFEFVDYCLLNQLVQNAYNVHELYKIALQVARGMVYIHSMKFIHRDLAARNILITINGDVKISDFGLSRKLSLVGAYNSTSKETPYQWEALESLTKKIYDKSSDVWMYGVLLYELYSNGQTPFAHLNYEGLAKHLKEGKRLDFPESMPESIRRLQQQCMLKTPRKRPKFKRILSTFQ